MNFNDLIKRLEQDNANKKEYLLDDIVKISNEILSNVKYDSDEAPTPIIDIIRKFDFVPYEETMSAKLSGDIFINGNTKRKYGCDKVILVNKKDELHHQRFVMAHELGHYLFDYLGNSKYANQRIKFKDTYRRNQHETPKEKRANTFAANLLMPREVFINQYYIATKLDSRPLFPFVYLSEFFEVTIESVERRMYEVFK